MMRALAILCLTSTMAAASGDLPALYAVMGVGPDDALNVRAGPDATSYIVGKLDHDARDIEVVRIDETNGWGQINTGEQAGWVSMRYLKATSNSWINPTGDPVLPNIADFAVTHCYGTEPFWSLNKNGEAVILDMVDREPMSGVLVHRSDSANRSDRLTVQALLERGAGQPQGGMSATVRGEICSDGMSDRLYGIGIDLVFTDPETDGEAVPQMLSGCCSIQPPAR